MERQTRRVLIAITFLVTLTGVCQLAVMFWARHEMNQAEAIVAVHSLTLASSGHLYYDLNNYPFTVSPYMPLFYSAAAGLDRLGFTPLLAGRLLSASGLLGIFFLSWRIIGRTVSDPYARWMGTLLVAGTANLWYWGTVGRVDILAICFSLAALDQYFLYRANKDSLALIWSAAWLVLSILTKQTMLAAGATIILALALSNLRRAIWLVLGVGGLLLTGAMAFNMKTDGRFFDNAIRSNLIRSAWRSFDYKLSI